MSAPIDQISVDNVWPLYGPLAGGTRVTITGQHVSASTVRAVYIGQYELYPDNNRWVRSRNDYFIAWTSFKGYGVTRYAFPALMSGDLLLCCVKFVHWFIANVTTIVLWITSLMAKRHQICFNWRCVPEPTCELTALPKFRS